MMKLPPFCAYCAEPINEGQGNREHFVPKCFWEANRPSGTEVIPVHYQCNDIARIDAEYLRDLLVLNERTGSHPQVIALRNGTFGRKYARQPKLAEPIISSVQERVRFDSNGVYMGVGYLFVPDWDRIKIALNRIMRGIFHVVKFKKAAGEHGKEFAQTSNHSMPLSWNQTDFCELSDKNYRYFLPMINQMVPWQSFGDDVFECRYCFGNQVDRLECVMRFYGKVYYYGSCMTQQTASDIAAFNNNNSAWVRSSPDSDLLVPRFAA